MPGVVGGLLALYLFFLPVQVRVGSTFRLAPSDLLLAGAALLLFSAGWFRVRRTTISPWHLFVIAIFAVAIGVTAIREIGISRYVLLNKGIGLLVLVTGYLLITSLARDWERLRWILRVFLGSVVVHTVLAMISFALLYGARIRVPGMNAYTFRLSGMLVDPNAFGGLLVLSLALLLATRSSPRPLIEGWAGAISILILAMGVLLTFSRSAWLALAVVVAVVSLYDLRVALAALGAAVAGFATLIAMTGFDYLGQIVDLAFRGSTIDARLEYIVVALDEFLLRPVLGTGLGYFLEQYDFIIHNTPLWILAEFGILGLVVFSLFFGWFLWVGVRALRAAPRPQRHVVLGLILAFLAMGALSVGIEALYQRHWWLIMALIASANGLTRTDVVRRPEPAPAGALAARPEPA